MQVSVINNNIFLILNLEFKVILNKYFFIAILTNQ